MAWLAPTLALTFIQTVKEHHYVFKPEVRIGWFLHLCSLYRGHFSSTFIRYKLKNMGTLKHRGIVVRALDLSMGDPRFESVLSNFFVFLFVCLFDFLCMLLPEQ